MVGYNFNAQQYEPGYGSSHKQLPPGKKYKGIISDSEAAPTRDGKGQMMVFTIRVVEGPLAGQEMNDRLNLHNMNAQTVEIANRQLSAYCHVLGVYQIADTQQLHNIPFLFDVDWQKGQEPTQAKPEGGYTEVKALYDINGNAPGKAGQGKPAQTATVAAPPPPPGNVAPANNAGGWGAPAAQTGAQNPPPPNGNAGWQQNPNGANANAAGGWGGR